MDYEGIYYKTWASLAITQCRTMFRGKYVLAWLHLLAGLSLASEYSPKDAKCPAKALLRSASGLSDSEQDWIIARDQVTHEALINWLDNSDLQDFDASQFFAASDPNSKSTARIGLAFSGGGYRAMLSGAGMLEALDRRSPVMVGGTSLGGLLQASSYVAGLSGGAWLVGSVAVNNWTTIERLQGSPDLWNFENVFSPSMSRSGLLGRLQISWNLEIVEDVLGKAEAGFPISFTDVWGRLLSAQTLGGDHGRSTKWSDLLNYEGIAAHQMPLPILLCDSVPQNSSEIVSLNSTIYEVSPFEFGSWDPSVYSFMETKYLGTSMNGGVPTTKDDCIVGYDNYGFVIGASSTIFNQIVQSLMHSISALKDLYDEVVNRVKYSPDLAIVGGNPFAEIDYIWKPISSSKVLELTDGGEDGENIPLSPLLQPDREIDLVLAFDNSADDSRNWPSGESLVSTYQRQFSPQGNNTAVPYIPSTDAFKKYGLLEQPVFFGCNLLNDADANPIKDEDVPPVIIYIANSKHSYSSNFSTFKLSYNNTERDNVIRNGYNVATQNSGTLDREWRTCVACAVILREQQRRGDSPSDQCGQCFSRYCFEEIKASAESRYNGPETQHGMRRDGQFNLIDGAQFLTTDSLGLAERYIY